MVASMVADWAVKKAVCSAAYWVDNSADLLDEMTVVGTAVRSAAKRVEYSAARLVGNSDSLLGAMTAGRWAAMMADNSDWR